MFSFASRLCSLILVSAQCGGIEFLVFFLAGPVILFNSNVSCRVNRIIVAYRFEEKHSWCSLARTFISEVK